MERQPFADSDLFLHREVEVIDSLRPLCVASERARASASGSQSDVARRRRVYWRKNVRALRRLADDHVRIDEAGRTWAVRVGGNSAHASLSVRVEVRAVVVADEAIRIYAVDDREWRPTLE